MLMAEFLTAVRNQLPVKVIINNNGSLGQILWEQMVLGYPEYGVRFPQPVADFAAWATACGGYGAKVDNPKKVESAIKDALAFDGPAIIDIDVDPNEPPLPGKGGLRPGEEVRPGLPEGPAAQGRHRLHPVQGQDRAARPLSGAVINALVTGRGPPAAAGAFCHGPLGLRAPVGVAAGCSSKLPSRPSHRPPKSERSIPALAMPTGAYREHSQRIRLKTLPISPFEHARVC
jgi:hypothetical protein